MSIRDVERMLRESDLNHEMYPSKPINNKMSKETIAQQLGITRYPFTIYDDRNLQIYYENLEEDGSRYWARCEYDAKGNRTLRENSRGEYSVREYDDQNRRVYYRSEEHWWRKQFDSVGEVIFYETNTGIHIDNRDE